MISDYIGIPFEQVNCYGLVKLYYYNELGVSIPDTVITPTQPKRIMINYLNEISKNWGEVKTPEKHNVIAMAMHEEHPKLITHFGIMLDNNKVLHTLEKIGSHIIDLDDVRIKPFIKGFYRWQH